MTTRAEPEDHLWSADHSLRNAALDDERGDGTRSHIWWSESYRTLLRISDAYRIAAFSG